MTRPFIAPLASEKKLTRIMNRKLMGGLWCGWFFISFAAVTATGCNSKDLKRKIVPEQSNRIDEETKRFHQIVEHGTLEELRESLAKAVPVNAHGHIGKTALMVAIDANDVEKMKLLLAHGADAELADDFNYTALMHAVQADFADGVRLLLNLRVDRGYDPKYPLKQVNYDDVLPETPMPEELRSVMSEAEWNQSREETRKTMREFNETPVVRPVISEVQTLGILKMFLDAGDDPSLASNEMKRELVGLKPDVTVRSTRNDFLEFRSPRFGERNPDRMDNLFWQDMIRMGRNAYWARQQFHDMDMAAPVWCYDRFGASLTPLPDGRYIQIGGEHEDFYDPDFYIYNDVVVHDGSGGFQIFGYPKDVFPPTDFHSATLAGEYVYIVGCLGYSEDRRIGFTPVYRLSLNSWEMSSVVTSGEMPGWIHGHRAIYDKLKNAIHVDRGELEIQAENAEGEFVSHKSKFELDLSTFTWRKL